MREREREREREWLRKVAGQARGQGVRKGVGTMVEKSAWLPTIPLQTVPPVRMYVCGWSRFRMYLVFTRVPGETE